MKNQLLLLNKMNYKSRKVFEMTTGKQVKQETNENETFRAIDAFMTTKRKKVLHAFLIQDEWKHGDLAAAAETSPASLSNIMIKFDQFPYPLLSCRSAGKYRYYSLTDLGKAYLAYSGEDDRPARPAALQNHEELLTFREIKDCLNQLKKTYEDDWDYMLDTELLRRIYFGKPTETGIEADRLLTAIGKLEGFENETLSYRMMELFPSNILRNRLAEFLNLYGTFRLITKALEAGDNVFPVFEAINRFIAGTAAEQDVKSLGWADRFSDLKVLFRKIADKCKNCEKEELFRCLNWYLPGNEVLAAYLCNLIWKHEN